MAKANDISEVCFLSDDNAIHLAAELFPDRQMGVWSPYCAADNKVIVAGGSNDYHDGLYHILNEAGLQRPVTLLFLDQHMDNQFAEAWPAFGAAMVQELLEFNHATFMAWVEKLDQVDQIIYLGESSRVPSDHEYGMERGYIANRIQDLFMYTAERRTRTRPAFENVTPEMLDNPLFSHMYDVLKLEQENPTNDQSKTELILPSFYSQRKKVLENIASNPTIESWKQNIDNVIVEWKNVTKFDPSVIRNEDVWIGLDYDVFDASSHIPTAQAFGTVPYSWFFEFLNQLSGHNIVGFDYWGYDQEKSEGEPTLNTLREVHEAVKEKM